MSVTDHTILASARLNALLKYVNLAVGIVGGLVLVPIYLRYLGTSQYGAWLAVGAFATWFAAMDPGIANLLIQRVSQSHGENDHGALSGYVSAGGLCALAVAVLVVLAGLLMAPWVVGWLKIESVPEELLIKAFRLAVAGTGMMILLYAVLAVLQGMHLSLLSGGLMIMSNLGRMIASVALLELGFGLLALPMAVLAIATVVTLIALIALVRHWRIDAPLSLRRFDRFREFSGLFAYSFGARFGKTIAMNLDNVVLARFMGADQVAMYSITATAPRYAENFVNLPMTALRPPLAHLSGAGREDALRRHTLRLLCLLIWLGVCLATGLLALTGSFVELWVGGDQFAGGDVAALLAVLCALRIWTSNTGMVGFSLGEIRRNSVAEWLYSLLLVLLIIIFAWEWGLVGVVLAHILAQSLTLFWYFPRSIWLKLGWTSKEASILLKELFAALAAGLVAYLSMPNQQGWIGFLAAGCFLVAIYTTALLALSKKFRYELGAQLKKLSQ